MTKLNAPSTTLGTGPECPTDKVKLTLFGVMPVAAALPPAAAASATRPWWKFWG